MILSRAFIDYFGILWTLAFNRSVLGDLPVVAHSVTLELVQPRRPLASYVYHALYCKALWSATFWFCMAVASIFQSTKKDEQICYRCAIQLK
jgi:hypothetical protein